MTKDRKEILREERVKREIEVRQTKVERKRKEEEIFERSNSEDWVKAGRRRKGVVIEALLDSEAMGLVISEEFAKKHKFKRTKLERPVYVRNIDGMLNYAGPNSRYSGGRKYFSKGIRRGHR